MNRLLRILQTIFFTFAFLDVLGLAIGIISFQDFGVHINQFPSIIQYWIVGSFIGLVVLLPVLFGVAIYYIFFDK